MSTTVSGIARSNVSAPAVTDELAHLELRLPTLLSVIAGMVDLTGFLTLGNLFTAHITGNLVVLGAVIVRGGPLNVAQALAIPMFIIAVAGAWLVARVFKRRGLALVRLLLIVQCALLAAVLIFCVITRPSTNPHGLMAGIAAMIAVSAMAVQYALFRLAMPRTESTAVMTGNLTNSTLSVMDAISPTKLLPEKTDERFRQSWPLLIGFFVGVVFAAAAVSKLEDWAWVFPLLLSGVVIVVR